MRILRALVALATLALVLAPFAAARSQVVVCPGVETDGTWTKILSPRFSTGPSALSSYEVNALAPHIILASNGKVVMRTQDGGCSWDEVFVMTLLPTLENPISAQNSDIVDIEIPEHGGGNNRVHLLVAERIGPAARPHIITSRNFGDEPWAATEAGLQLAAGEPLGLHISRSSPNIMFLHLRTPATGGDSLYATLDGGASWSERVGPTGGIPVHDMAIDPLDADELWFWGAGGLFHSVDGGRTRALVDYAAPPVPMATVWNGTGGQSVVMAYQPETSSFIVTTNGGRSWFPLPAPIAPALDVVHGTGPADVVLSLHESVHRFKPPQYWDEITPSGAGDLLDLSVDRTSKPSVYGRTPTTIWKYLGLHTQVTIGDFNITDIALDKGVSKLLPEKVEMKLKPRQTRELSYSLSLPQLPNPLDVFFLLDTSGSMDPTISGLRVGMQEIIDELGSAGIDAKFGIGDYKDYPIPGYGNPENGDYPYHLGRAIGPADEELEIALEQLEASGGGRDIPESQLTGLYQAVTGAGDPGFVSSGQDAGFRGRATKVIVHMTDAPFHKEVAHPSPDFDVVANELSGNDILQIGLSIFGINGADGEADLENMAEATRTLTPAGGVDCDGNGTIDLAEGTPLVCDISDRDNDGSMNLAPAIIATLKAVTEDAPVSIEPTGTKGLVASVTPDEVSAVNLKEKNELTFDVTFDCPAAFFGTKKQVTLEAVVREQVVDSGTATIRCLPPPRKPEKKKDIPAALLAPTAAGTLTALAIVPPAPPPPAIEQVTSTQNAAQAQGAMATEQQEELQVAVAQQRSTFSSAREEQYLFSDYKDRSAASTVPLYVAAGVMALAFGAAGSLRTRARAAFARRR